MLSIRIYAISLHITKILCDDLPRNLHFIFLHNCLVINRFKHVRRTWPSTKMENAFVI